MTLNEFANDLNDLEHVIKTTLVNEEDTEYLQVAWNVNPAEQAAELHQIKTNYPDIAQVVPSETLRDQNPENAEITQYFTLK